jgi:ubiquinone/menaquinone biosynthesis C-methylase UbiE
MMHKHTSSTDTYLMGRTPEEMQRLQRQAQLLGPSLQRLFEQAGITVGMRVLDVGSGAGDVAMLAASMVGPGGAVVGVEINSTILDTARARAYEAGLSNVTFLAEDIENLQLDTEFDAIVGRAILLYLRDPVGTLQKLAKHLRPGGVVAFQEADMARVATLPAHPPCQLWEHMFFWSLEAFRQAGVPLRMGLDLYRVFLDAGLPAPQMSCEGVIGAGPDWPGYDYYAETLRSLLPRILKLGIATEKEVAIETLAERLRTEATSQRSVLRGHDLISAWARTSITRESQ